MNNRRNPFEESASVQKAAALPSLYDSLRVAAPRSRNREWEQRHQSHKAVYRGVDPKLSLQVKSIANKLFVPEGEVARALIEYAFTAYEQGDLVLNPRPNPYRLRMTLFPVSDSGTSQDQMAKPAKRKQSKALWRFITTWRGFPPELKNKLSTLAGEEGLSVPIGELITALLRFGLKDYERGLLPLEPVQKRTALTLALECES